MVELSLLRSRFGTVGADTIPCRFTFVVRLVRALCFTALLDLRCVAITHIPCPGQSGLPWSCCVTHNSPAVQIVAANVAPARAIL